jgi:hypothetical protein
MLYLTKSRDGLRKKYVASEQASALLSARNFGCLKTGILIVSSPVITFNIFLEECDLSSRSKARFEKETQGKC